MSLNEHEVVFYNEWDKKTASWLKELIKHGSLPFGKVNTHSITELKSTDLLGYKQCHFFAGIGGWPLALRIAGLEDMSGVWTGSPPCQPFSLAGKGKALDDERHLAPIWIQLIRESKPTIVFGEQVEAAIKFGWLDDLFDALENIGYACVSAVLPACSVGAPHLRKRLFFGAVRLADANSKRLQGGGADTYSKRWKGQNIQQMQLLGQIWDRNTRGKSNTHKSFWSNVDWLKCTDNKFRPVESSTFPLANGVPARMGRLRGYGNAIVPQVGAVFAKAFIETIIERR